MTATYTEEHITFPVQYRSKTVELKGRVFAPKHRSDEQKKLPPVVFNSGYTGGASMYGQLFGKALSELGYVVMTYDVAGFFSNKAVHNTYTKDGKTVTRVSLDDQKQEVLAAVKWTRERFGKMPAVLSWAMGATVSLAAVIELQKRGGEQIPYYVPMSYTNMRHLQRLRADAAKADADIQALADDAAVPPFDTGTEATRLGYYPLDVDTQAYVDQQLGGYTDAEGVDHWPGCAWVSADSYKESVSFDPEKELAHVKGLPPVLVVHGTDNTLHMPAESERMHKAYPGSKTEKPLLVKGMQHGQQLQPEHPIFHQLVKDIDAGIREAVGLPKQASAA